MGNDTLQALLDEVGHPSRYLGSEVNRVCKDPGRVALHVALAFPDLYEIGTSHFGLQILYDILNRHPRIAAERVFAPAGDMDAALAARGLPLASLESGRPLARFDIVGFSLLYELNYTNVLAMLARGGVPFRAAERDGRHPLVIAGGPCTCNPEPLAPFFDAMVVGDGEEVILALAEAWLGWDRKDRDRLLDRWAGVPGVYVPGRFVADYRDGFQRLSDASGAAPAVRRAVVADLDRQPAVDRPVVPFGRPVHDRLRIEIARGCTRGCRFCQAGMIYRPVRERSPARLMETIRSGLRGTGYEDLSLLSLSTGDYSCIAPLAESLMTECTPRHVALSLPSLRAGTIGPGLMEQIRRVRKTGFTIAVEAGSQRLRDVINKNVRERDVVETVQNAFDLGWQTIKLYFMVGLPTETDTDREAIVALVDRLRKLRAAGGRRGKINVSLAAFIPKPHTPFQWAAQMALEEAREAIEGLRRRLQRPGVQVKWQNPRVSWLEGLWARGDRRLAPLLVEAHRRGCRFDGWSDRFRYDAWCEAIAACGIDADFFTLRRRDLHEPLPWDHVDSGVEKGFLQDEWKRALEARGTADCRRGECQGCGVCDFVHLAPVVHSGAAVPAPLAPPNDDAAGYRPLRLRYRKTGRGRLFGHLETVNIFLRALRRAGIALQYTGGFHPKPRIAFDDPLPLGIESLEEFVSLHVAGHLEPEIVASRLDAEMPRGFEVLGCEAPVEGTVAEGYRYRVEIEGGGFDRERLRAFEKSRSWPLERVSAKGRRQRIDLRQAVHFLRAEGDGRLEMGLRCRQGPTVRPGDVLREVFRIDPATRRGVRIVKLGADRTTASEGKSCSAN